MEIAIGTPVYGRKGAKVGEVSYIILDGQTEQTTHIIVSKGWLLPRDIVVPLANVQSTSPDELTLDIDEAQLEEQPNFIETHYVRPDPEDPLSSSYAAGSFLYRPVAPATGMGWYMPYTTMGTLVPPIPVGTERNVPDGSIALAEGMDVRVGDKKAGTLVGVRLHPRTERATHIVVSKGGLFADEQMLPVSAITSVDHRGIQLVI